MELYEKNCSYYNGTSCSILISPIVEGSSKIQAFLFNVKFKINEKYIELPSQYKVLNYNSYTYLPSRYIVENMGGTIIYDDRKNEIKISYLSPSKPLYSDYRGYYPELKVGNLTIKKSDENKNILEGAHAIFGAKNEHTIGYSMIFFDKDGKEIDRIGVGDTIKVGETKSFSKPINISNYSSVKLELSLFDEVIGGGSAGSQ